MRSFEIYELVPGKIEEAVASREVDLGITYMPIPKAGVKFTEVTKIDMGVFGASRPAAGLSFEKLPFVVPLNRLPGAPSKVQGLDGWPDHRYPRAVRYKVTLMESALSLCRQGLAVGYFPKFIVHLHNAELKRKFQLVEHECPVPKKDRIQSVYLVEAAGETETKDIREIGKILRSIRQ